MTKQISNLAKKYGLSRSTLLYYDKIGLLSPSGRTLSNYRNYSRVDEKRLELICSFRDAGIPVKNIRSIIDSGKDRVSLVLKERLRELGSEILELKRKQRLIAGMLGLKYDLLPLANVDKGTWVEMLSNAGVDERVMRAWHSEFERKAPSAHHEFLLSLGIEEGEALKIRRHARRSTKG